MVVRGPARSFCLASNRYQVVFVFSLMSACWPARSAYNESLATGKPCAPIEGAHEIGLEVEELELCGLAENLDRILWVLDARQVDHDLVRPLLADLRLRDAEPVDAVAHDPDRAVEVGLLELPVRRRHRLQRDLETALEVEPERRRLLDRRAGNGKEPDADESGGDQCDEGEVRSAIHGSSGVG